MLCDEHRDRIEENPLRVLDCKTAGVRRGHGRRAPTCSTTCAIRARAHFDRVRTGLDALAVPFMIEPRSSAVSTTTRARRSSSQPMRSTPRRTRWAAVGATTGWWRSSGGPPTPAIGFALGVERILLACDAEGVFAGAAAPGSTCSWSTPPAGDAARDLTHALRDAGVRADRAFDDRSMKAQFKQADRSGAPLALVVGPDELEQTAW